MFDFLLNMSQLTDFLGTGFRLSIPIAFAALGGVLSERAGVYNIGLEGCVLSGAFGGAVGAVATGTPWGGVVFALLFSRMAGVVLAGLSVLMRVNQIVAGIAINILMLGFTSYFARVIFPDGTASQNISGFQTFELPLLSKIPIIGQPLFHQDALFFSIYLLVPLAWWIMYRTPWGLQIRAIGEYPRAADTAGISVLKTRFIVVVISCALAGLGGAYIVLSQVFVFTENMSAGKGFVALAALILGRWNPIGALMAAVFFGFADALQLRMQFSSPEVPYQFFAMLPYVASILALIVFAGKVKPPAALGLDFIRSGK